MSSFLPESGGAAATAPTSNGPAATAITISQAPAMTTAALTTTTAPTSSSASSTSISSSASESSSMDASSLAESLSPTMSSQTPTPTPQMPEDPSPVPIQSAKENEHLARNICLGIFLLFAVVALIGFAYWGIPRLMRKRADRKSRKAAVLPFANDDAKGSLSAQHRSAMLMPGRNNSIVSFDSRSPAEKSKSNVNSPASLAFSPPVSPKSPALWTEHNNSNIVIPATMDANIANDESAANDSSNVNTTSRSNSHSHARSTTRKMVPRSAAPTPPPQRPLSRPPPLDMEDVPRAVFYSHPAPSMTTVASYPYEDEDSSLWAFVPPQSPFGVNRPSSPPVSQMPNAPRRDSDTYPRTPYL